MNSKELFFHRPQLFQVFPLHSTPNYPSKALRIVLKEFETGENFLSDLLSKEHGKQIF